MLIRFLTSLAAALVPPAERPDFRAHWSAALAGLRVIVDRGECPGLARRLIATECRHMFAAAIRTRGRLHGYVRAIRGPAFLLTVPLAAVLVTCIVSHGFTATRALLHLARMPDIANPRHTDPFGVFLSYLLPIVFAFVTGLMMAISRGPGLNRFGWRYGIFFFVKIALVAIAVPLIWIELTPLIRMLRPNREISVLLTALLSRFAFTFAFVCALAWCFDDQRRRCPVCLKRLSLPVRMGSWASVFDPVTTEVMCEDGHGTLALGTPDRWVKLDESWQDLFSSPGL